MNKKGFTLVELLAVIVILSIIALIATPLVLTIIDDTRYHGKNNSVNGLLDAAELYYSDTLLTGDTSKINGSTNLIDEIAISGEKPKDGTLYINENGDTAIAVVYDDVCYEKEFNDKKVSQSKDIENCKVSSKPVDINNTTNMEDYEFPKPIEITNSKILRVLIIDIDPILTKGTIQGKSCVGMTTSECLGQNKQQAINEIIEDIEYSSHGAIDVQIVKTDYLNEFATHKKEFTLSNGQKSKKLDEDTWLNIMKNGWYGFWDNAIVKSMGDYTIDYEYLINKLNLIERRNRNEFQEVWIVNEDPTKTYESVMIGKTAYWINGPAITANCENFKVMNVSISRPDTNYECNGHAAENVLNKVFGSTPTTIYSKNNISINSNNYNSLNLWQKFTLTEYNNSNKSTGLSGVGNVHFSPNSQSDYDWSNKTNKVASKWKDWLNYPNLTNTPSNELFDPSVYLDNPVSGTNNPARLHHRWWFWLMPHLTGYTSDGYSNNWWDYIYNGDFVSYITSVQNNYTYKVGEYVDNIKITNHYHSTKIENITLTKYENNMSFTNKSIFGIDDTGKIVAKAPGTSELTYYRDGKLIKINITVE